MIEYRGGSWCDRVEEGVGVIECRERKEMAR